MIASAVKADLLGMLKSFGGYGDGDNRPSSTGKDHEVDHSRKATGYANNDQNQFKSSLKDIWKTHD